MLKDLSFFFHGLFRQVVPARNVEAAGFWVLRTVDFVFVSL